MVLNLEKFSLPVAIIVGALIIGGVLLFLYRQEKVDGDQGISLSPEEVAQATVDFINQNLLTEGATATLIKTTEESGVYKIRIEIGGEEYDSYVTKDGKILFPEGFNLESILNTTSKQDRPDVKLFIMSYCPFGLQAQKMFLPVYNLLKDKVDMGVYFVSYIMHDKKEIDENLRQYCIQKEEKEKYYSYLNCFVKDGNFEECLSSAQIDRIKLTNCITDTDQKYNIYSQYEDQSTWSNGLYPKFDVHSDLNQEYGVGGSPTIVINGQITNVNPRSPENFKTIICNAFNSPPEECSQVLSSESSSSGFGLETGSSSGGSCE